MKNYKPQNQIKNKYNMLTQINKPYMNKYTNKFINSEGEYIKPNRAEYLKNNSNFRYCIAYLKNSGERIRAIRLVMDTCKIPILEAQEWVDNLHYRIK